MTTEENDDVYYTSPNANGGGNLPSGYSDLQFTLANANWVKYITLPQSPEDNDKVEIVSSATYASYVDIMPAGVPLRQLEIQRNTPYVFIYDADTGYWGMSGPGIIHLTPRTSGSSIQSTAAITYYSTYDGNWAKEIRLPEVGRTGDLIIIRSNATYDSRVLPENMLYASTTTIERGDQYVFKFLNELNFPKWVVENSPVRNVRAVDVDNAPTAPQTEASFYNSNWVSPVKLPASAGDRDRFVIKSTAQLQATIDSSNVNNYATMKLSGGDEYEFMYVAENKKWEMMRHPDTIYQAKDLLLGIVPALTKPRTIIHAADGNWHRNITLPKNQHPGSRVILDTKSTYNINVIAGGLIMPVTKGEIVAFKVDENRNWERETVTIDWLLLYSEKAAQIIGEDAARNKLTKGVSQANDALENSGANFRFRIKAISQISPKPDWKTLPQTISALPNDPDVQKMRDDAKADGILYIGAETDPVGATGRGGLGNSAGNFVAGIRYNARLEAVRHELGHTMGVHHGAGETSSYNRGYPQIRTIMNGNKIPYFSNPKRYTADYGIPMGIENEIDAVRAMNEGSAQRAAYR